MTDGHLRVEGRPGRVQGEGGFDVVEVGGGLRDGVGCVGSAAVPVARDHSDRARALDGVQGPQQTEVDVVVDGVAGHHEAQTGHIQHAGAVGAGVVGGHGFQDVALEEQTLFSTPTSGRAGAKDSHACSVSGGGPAVAS